MFDRSRIISHLVLWSFIAAGVLLAFSFISPEIIFKKSFNKWLIILPLSIFFYYYFFSACYWRSRFHLNGSSEKRIIRAGVYGRCAHPTCTNLVILSWIIFFFFPDARVLASAAWLTTAVFFWIKIEESFFIGHRSKVETKKPEPS